MSDMDVTGDPLDILKRYFGFSHLREGQDTVIHHILAGSNVLVVMPTGGGKSLCYQLPALCRDGITIVVSPLIALMKDQVDALLDKGIPATMINSSLGLAEQKSRLSAIRQGLFKLVYVAPERFGQPGFMRQISEMQVSMVAIDEAHCLSQWGHDFRPDYLKLGKAIQSMGNPQVVALTATATPKVRTDILEHLQLSDPETIVHGFARENLHFNIVNCANHDAKYKRLIDLAHQYKTGIIYCSTRKKVEQIYEKLTEMDMNVTAYHAGMTDQQRELAQNEFIDKKADIVIATNAFGMGIDRNDVRFVAHFEIPGSIEAYYQEAGRAGRDGLDAYCELLFNHADLRTQEFFIDGANPNISLIVDLYELLRRHVSAENNSVEWTMEEMSERLKVKNGMAISSALVVLMKSGVIHRYDIPGKRIKGTQVADITLSGLKIPIDYQALEDKEQRDRDKLKSMTEFAYSHGCRQQWILNYFGEDDSAPCGKCDQCAQTDTRQGSFLDEEQLTIVRQALSGIARASVRGYDGQWRGRWGKVKLIQMLKGSKTQDIMKTSLAQLSTYGILSHLSEDHLRKLFQSIQLAGLLCFNGEPDRPLMTISPKGHRVMMGKENLQLIWPLSRSCIKKSTLLGDSSKKEMKASTLNSSDENLYEALKSVRNALAKEKKVPPYQIFHNSTLEEMARIKPTTESKAMNIRGVGPNNIQYLEEFLEMIYDHVSP